MADIIQIRRDTASRWATANPILADGEMGLEKDNDNIKIKIGDGIHPWNELKYISSGEFIINIDYIYPKQSGYYTKNEARNIVNQNQRIRGLIITYNVSATQRICEQYINSDITGWGLDSNWSPIGEKGDPGDILPSSIQADFTENDSTSPSFIQHKPDLSEYQKKIDENINFRSGENTVVTALNKVEDNTYDTNISSDYINALGTISGSEYDEVTYTLGEGYRMPTLSEVNELLNACTKTIVTINDVQYCKLNNNENQEGVIYPLGKIWIADFVSNSSGKLIYTIELSENDSITNDSRCSNNYVIAVTRLQTEGFEDLGLSSGLRWGKYVLGASVSNPSGGVKYPFAMHTTTNGSWSEYLCLENECNTINDPLYPSSTDILHKDNTNKHISNADRERLLYIGNTRELPIPGQTIVEAINKLNEKIANIPEPSRKHLLGGISVADLEALTDMVEGDIWAVFASGDEESGFSSDDFTFNGIPCTAGTFIGYTNNQWLKYNDINLDEALIISPQQKEILIPFNYNRKFVSIHTRSGQKTGLRIFDFHKYILNDGKYIRQTESDSSSSLTDIYSIVIPYAGSYIEGGERYYREGILTAADYQRLMEGMAGKDVFVAEYEVTTFQELEQAYEDGKLIIVKQGPIIAVLGYFYVNEFRFFAVDTYANSSNATIYVFRMSYTNGWSGSNLTTENKGDRVSSSEISESLITDNKYLSALATKTLIEQYGGGVEIDTSIPQTPSNEHVPSTLLFTTQMAGKQNVLTFDSAPTANSLNPVTSGGIKTALDGKSDVNHTHSDYASASTVQEIITAMNGFATKSLDNLTSGAGGNIATAMTKTNTSTILAKLDAETSFIPEDTSYFVMSYGNGGADKVSSAAVANEIKSAVETAMEHVYVKKAVNNSILFEQILTITAVSTTYISCGTVNVRSYIKYNISNDGWFVAVGSGNIKISNASTQYGTVWDSNADNRISMGSGRAYICFGHKDLSYSQSAANFKKLIKYISSARWLFFNEKTGREQDILDYICPIAYVWENDSERYANCLMFVTKPIADIGIDSTVANTNSFFHLVVEGLPIENWD